MWRGRSPEEKILEGEEMGSISEMIEELKAKAMAQAQASEAPPEELPAMPSFDESFDAAPPPPPPPPPVLAPPPPPPPSHYGRQRLMYGGKGKGGRGRRGPGGRPPSTPRKGFNRF